MIHFASPYRPTSRVKTRERQQAPIASSADNEVSAGVDKDITESPLDNQTSQLATQFSFPINFKEHTENYEVELLKKALAESQYNQKKTAELLGLSYHQLRGILKKYNLLEKT